MKSSLVRIRHARSKQDFPFLSLEEGEYVELAIYRSKIGLIIIWVATIVALVLIGIAATAIIGSISRATAIKPGTMSYFWMLLISLFAVLILAGLAMSRIYLANKLYVTNKRIFHYKTDTLFSKSVNIVDLASIEDVSFKQNTVLDHIFSIGTVRMSTVGDETTYTFPFVDTPKDEIDHIAHLVHQTKNKT